MSENIFALCDECEYKGPEMKICLDCIETLCESCDKKFHNRGNRIKHFRITTPYFVYVDAQ